MKQRYGAELERSALFVRTRRPRPVGTLVRFVLRHSTGEVALNGIARVAALSRDPLDPGMRLALLGLDASSHSYLVKLGLRVNVPSLRLRRAAKMAAPAAAPPGHNPERTLPPTEFPFIPSELGFDGPERPAPDPEGAEPPLPVAGPDLEFRSEKELQAAEPESRAPAGAYDPRPENTPFLWASPGQSPVVSVPVTGLGPSLTSPQLTSPRDPPSLPVDLPDLPEPLDFDFPSEAELTGAGTGSPAPAEEEADPVDDIPISIDEAPEAEPASPPERPAEPVGQMADAHEASLPPIDDLFALPGDADPGAHEALVAKLAEQIRAELEAAARESSATAPAETPAEPPDEAEAVSPESEPTVVSEPGPELNAETLADDSPIDVGSVDVSSVDVSSVDVSSVIDASSVVDASPVDDPMDDATVDAALADDTSSGVALSTTEEEESPAEGAGAIPPAGELVATVQEPSSVGEDDQEAAALPSSEETESELTPERIPESDDGDVSDSFDASDTADAGASAVNATSEMLVEDAEATLLDEDQDSVASNREPADDGADTPAAAKAVDVEGAIEHQEVVDSAHDDVSAADSTPEVQPDAPPEEPEPSGESEPAEAAEPDRDPEVEAGVEAEEATAAATVTVEESPASIEPLTEEAAPENDEDASRNGGDGSVDSLTASSDEAALEDELAELESAAAPSPAPDGDAPAPSLAAEAEAPCAVDSHDEGSTPPSESPAEEPSSPGDQSPGDQSPGDQSPGDQSPEDESPEDESPEDQSFSQEPITDRAPASESTSSGLRGFWRRLLG